MKLKGNKKWAGNKHPPPKYKTGQTLDIQEIGLMKKEMSANCLNTLRNGRYQPMKFALSRPPLSRI